MSRSTHRGVVQVDAGCSGAVVLHEGPDEAQPECSFKQELGFPLVLRQAEEGHVSQVLLGRVQEELGPLLLWNGGHVVAAHEAQVRQHTDLQRAPTGGEETLNLSSRVFKQKQSGQITLILCCNIYYSSLTPILN